MKVVMKAAPEAADGCGRPSAERRIGRTATVSVLLAAAIGLGGCSVGPDYMAPMLDLPTKWLNSGSSKQTPARIDRWWVRFGDPQLSRLIDEAVEGNLDVAKAKAAIREARATLRQSESGLFPTLSNSDAVTRQKAGGVSNGSYFTGQTFTTYRAGFDAGWEIDLFGGTRRGIEAATRSAEASEDQLYATLLTLIGDVASNYIEARGYQARIDLARRTAASQRETAELTRARLAAGTASGVDVAKAEAQAASTEAAIPNYERAYAAAVHRIGVLLGRDPGAVVGRMRTGGAIPSPKRTLPAGIPAQVLASRPDVRAAERRLAAATALIGKAEADLYPSLTLSGALSSTGVKLGDLGKSSTVAWSVGPSVSIPILNGGRLKAAVDVAAAQRDQSFVAFKAVVLSALEDVENALVALAQERVRAESLTQASQRYRDASRLSRTLYQSGSSSFLDVLDAERSLFSAEDALIVSRVSIATDYVALAKALGGGWDKPTNVDKPIIVDVNTGPHLSAATPAATDKR
jgi:NodT family efflux transporter outer membrane factor (OMF) lipoprotein